MMIGCDWSRVLGNQEIPIQSQQIKPSINRKGRIGGLKFINSSSASSLLVSNEREMSSNITVSVPRAETQTDARTWNTYASYVIEAVNPEGLSWCRSFRYSDLHKFHFHLLAQMEDKKEAERLDKIFPPKRVFNNSFSVVEERRKALSSYFIALVSSPYIKPRLYLLRTLGLDQPPVAP